MKAKLPFWLTLSDVGAVTVGAGGLIVMVAEVAPVSEPSLALRV